MKKLSYGSVVGTLVQVDFMSQVEQAGKFACRRAEALSFQISASNSRPKHLESSLSKTTSPELPSCSHFGT